MKKIEFLFPELCYIYAESYNMEYLKRCSEEIEIIRTNHMEEPYFVNHNVDMIYLGCTTEDTQEYIIGILLKYKERISKLIENNTIFLFTGNAIEILGQYIIDGKRKIEALSLFDFYSERYMNRNRINWQYIGHFNDVEIVGHESQYSYSFGSTDYTFIKIDKGVGRNENEKIEGIHKNNLFATYSLGPFLILNPYFTKYLLNLLELPNKLPFEDTIIEAYEYRKRELYSKLK